MHKNWPAGCPGGSVHQKSCPRKQPDFTDKEKNRNMHMSSFTKIENLDTSKTHFFTDISFYKQVFSFTDKTNFILTNTDTEKIHVCEIWMFVRTGFLMYRSTGKDILGLFLGIQLHQTNFKKNSQQHFSFLQTLKGLQTLFLPP